MSRTAHNLPSRTMRNMRVQNRRKAEEAALDELNEVGVSFRHANRLASFWSIIPKPWDDKTVAAWSEYKNKIYWSNKFALNDEHWTKETV